MSDRRVVITGLGVVTPVGNDVATFWDSLVNARSGIGPITSFDTKDFSSKIGGEVRNFDPAKAFKNPKDARRSDRYTQLAMAAAKQAIEESGINTPGLDFNRIGVMLGSGIGGLITLEDQHTVLMQKGAGRLSPFLIPMLIGNIAAGCIAIDHGLAGPNMAIVTACASAAHSIGEAWRLIRDNEADAIVAGGSEASVCPIGVGGFCAMRALSTRNDDPTKASRPFDKDRDGFVIAEGSAVVVLEEYEHAKKRGAPIYCEIVGYGLSCDANHMTSPAPDGNGAMRAMKRAVERSGLPLEKIGYINAHGTSTQQGDICETMAVKSLFGDRAKSVAISSTKSMTGHMLGAAGSTELVACVKALQNGVIPPTINLDNPDPQCDLDYVPNTAREQKLEVVMSNSFGFGGHNASLMIAKI